MRIRLIPCLLALLTALPPLAVAQQLTLDVTVTDKKGTPIPGLQQTDFVTHIDNQTTPITSFQAVTAATTAAPVETILLIDAVNTRTTNIAYERSQIEKFLRKDGGHLAQPTTAIILTDTKVETLPISTRDGNALADAIQHAQIGLREFTGRQGFYSWSEQFDISSRALREVAAYERTRPGRKLLLWISPGWPLLSGPEVQLSKKEEDGFFNVLVSLTQDLRLARVTLSSIDPLGTADSVSYRTIFYQQFTKPVPDARHMQIGNLALQVIATQSGGRVLNSNNDTSALLTQAASDADAFYTITLPMPPADAPPGFHTIAVDVEKPGLTARTRTVLYATPLDAPNTQPHVPPPTH